MQKTYVTMMLVKVKEVIPPVPKESKAKAPYESNKLTQKRVAALLQETLAFK